MIKEGEVNQVNEMTWEHIISQGEGIYLLRKSGHIWGTLEDRHTATKIKQMFDGSKDNIIAKIKIKRKP